MPTTGVPTADAMWVGPVSPDTITAAPRVSAITPPIVVFGDATAAPSAAAAVSVASHSSPGPHRMTDIRPRRFRSSAASAANLSGGHRLFGHAAPGFRSTY